MLMREQLSDVLHCLAVLLRQLGSGHWVRGLDVRRLPPRVRCAHRRLSYSRDTVGLFNALGRRFSSTASVRCLLW